MARSLVSDGTCCAECGEPFYEPVDMWSKIHLNWPENKVRCAYNSCLAWHLLEERVVLTEDEQKARRDNCLPF